MTGTSTPAPGPTPRATTPAPTTGRRLTGEPGHATTLRGAGPGTTLATGHPGPRGSMTGPHSTHPAAEDTIHRGKYRLVSPSCPCATLADQTNKKVSE